MCIRDRPKQAKKEKPSYLEHMKKQGATKYDLELIGSIESDVLIKNPNVSFDSIAGQ